MKLGALQLTPLTDFPAVLAGDALPELIVAAARRQDLRPSESTVLVVAQKIVSKSEGRLVALDDVEVTDEARALARESGKDARLVSLILQEARAVLRVRKGLIIVEHRTGHILANAGIDASNVGAIDDEKGEHVLLWPADPDASARALSEALGEAFGQSIPVVINDSLGRP